MTTGILTQKSSSTGLENLYDLISSYKETIKPALEWNIAGIKGVKGKLNLYLNEENNIAIKIWIDTWKKLMAGSKFKNTPDFGIYKKGKIGCRIMELIGGSAISRLEIYENAKKKILYLTY